MSSGTFRPTLKALARKVLPVAVRRFLRGGRNRRYEVLEGEVPAELLRGWQDEGVAERQHAAFVPLLEQMREGKPREDFAAVATAIARTGLEDPLIIEVGCGSGWNSEVLAHLAQRSVRYIGLDCSRAMTVLGKRSYPEAQFVVGDAAALPFKDDACDILLSGTVLMHLLDYRRAVEESRRVARRWCIFHTVPILQQRGTTLLRKRAYGQPALEVIFNEGELRSLLKRVRLEVMHVLDSVPYDLREVLGEPTKTKTYVCEVAEC